MNFTKWLEENENDIVKFIIQSAIKARKELNINSGGEATYGTCYIVSKRTVELLNLQGINAYVEQGYFKHSEDEWYNHAWVKIKNDILDPTFDQFLFFTSGQTDTNTPGVYYSSSAWDGGKYVEFYEARGGKNYPYV